MIAVNNILITDIATDIYKKNEFWHILVTIYLELDTKNELETINYQVASSLHVSENLIISNASEIVFTPDELSRKNKSVTVQLYVPVVSFYLE